MKSTKRTPKVQVDQTVDICVDVSKSKLNVYFALGDQAFDDSCPMQSGKSRRNVSCLSASGNRARLQSSSCYL